MAYQKSYQRINWENYPSDKTPLNEANLNKLDVATDEIDNRVITLDNTKFDKTEASQLIKNIELDKATGVITITYLSGATATIDTMLEKLAVNFDFDQANQKLVITLDDNTTKEVDLKALITEYEFKDTDTVAFSVDADGNVSAIVKEGSIEEKHLRPNYLADIKVEVAKAQSSATASATSEANAKASEENAKLSENNAKESELNSKASETNAKDSETKAKASETASATSASNAKVSETNSKTSETNAKISEENAKYSETASALSEQNAKTSETNAENSAYKSESYAVGGTATRPGEDTDNSKYYSEQSKASSETSKAYLDKVEQAGNEALDKINNAVDVNTPNFTVDLSTGHLMYESTRFVFDVNETTGHLEWGLTV